MKELLLVALIAGGIQSGAEDPLLRARAWNGFIPGWEVTVWADGSAKVVRDAGPAVRLRLEKAKLDEVVQVLEQNRPWEIAGAYGQPIIDGPERVIDVSYKGKQATIHLYKISRSVAGPKPPRGFEAHARAVRICEAARRVAAADWIQECTDK